MSQIKISAAICTHNRSQDLAECLAALAPQIRDGLEMMVIDSASKPEEAAKIADIVALYPFIRFQRLERPGLAIARNAALSMAQGEWLALLDDDAVPAADWVAVALDLADRLGPEYSIVGGAVRPLLPAGAERPLGRRWRQLLSTIQLDGEFDQTDRPAVVGANMWFKVEALKSVGAFPESLGRIGNSLLSGEEKLPTHKLVEQGRRIWYSDRLKVGHKIHGDRLTRKWATRRAYWDGISDKRVERMLGKPDSAKQTASVALKMLALGALYPAPGADQEFFLRFWYNLGWLRERFHRAEAS